MCKGSQTTTSNQSYSPNPQALQAYSRLLTQAQGVAANPYQRYTGELVAGINPQEQAGIAGINQYSNFAQPYLQQGLQLASNAAQPITAGQIRGYESPYTQDVVNTTQNQFNLQNAIQRQGITGNAIAQGAFGGNRVGVAQANLANSQQTAQAPVIAGLENQGYQTGLNTALTEQQAGLQGAYGLAGIGVSGQNALLSGAQQQIGAGQLEQGTQQALDTALYQQYLNQQAYPFQTTQWLAGLESALGSQMGGTGNSSTTGASPSWLSQLGGLGTLATGLGGSSGLLSWLSDRHAKENIKAIGKLNDGQVIYRFNYKGDPTTHVGLIAQEVEKKHPEAVHKQDGVRFVDYNKATKDAVDRAYGGVVPNRQFGGGMDAATMMMPAAAGSGVAAATPSPYAGGGGGSYVPAVQLPQPYPFSWRLPNAPPAPNQNGGMSPQQTGQNAAMLAKGVFGTGNKTKNQTPDGVAGTPLNLNTNPDVYIPDSTGTVNPTGFAPATGDLGAIYYRGGAVHRDSGGGVAAANGTNPSDAVFGGIDPSQTGVAVPPPAPTASTPTDVPMPVARPSAADDVPLPNTGVAVPVSYTQPGSADLQDSISSYQHSIGGIESGNDYSKVGPTTKSGDRAYGRYQIMGRNIPEWTAQTLGQSMTPEEFMANPQAQDAVFRSKFGQYVNQYGPEGAARAWYAGPGGMNNDNAQAHDVNGNPIGLTVASYGQKFMQGLGLRPGSVLPPSGGGVNAPPSTSPAQDNGVAGGQPGFLQKTFPNVDFSANSRLWPALIAAGAGMMASRSPFPGVAIGEGAQAGLSEYQAQKAAEMQGSIKQEELRQNALKLSREADQFAVNYQMNYQKMEMERRKELMDEMKPIQIGQGPMGPIYAVRDPKLGAYRTIDPQTGELGNPIGLPGAGGAGGPPPTNPLGGTAPLTPIPPTGGGAQSGPPPVVAGGPSPGPTAGQPAASPTQAAVFNPDARAASLAPPQLVQTGANSYDDVSSGLRNVLKTDLTSTEGLNQDAVKTLQANPVVQKNPGLYNRIMQVARGFAPIPPTTGRSSYENQFIADQAFAINPALNQGTFAMRQRALNFFAVGTQGGGGQQFIAFNRWLAHAGRLESIAEQLGMGPNMTWNAIKNAATKSGWGQTLGLTDDQAQKLLGEFEVEAKGVSSEGAKVLAGAHPGVTDREEWEKTFSPDTPLSVMRSKIGALMSMGHDAMEANAAQYNLDMGANHTPEEFLSSRARTIMHTMQNGGNMTDTLKRLDAGQQSSVRPVDQKAVDWANAHPNDPRAAQIKQKLGIQ